MSTPKTLDIPLATTASRARLFRSLHQSPPSPSSLTPSPTAIDFPLLLANVYDPISARLIGSLPQCRALATASYALALSINKSDDTLTLSDNLSLCKPIAAVAHELNLPLTMDIQDGYAASGDLDALKGTIKKVITELGIVGVNIEDSWHQSLTGEMMSEDEAVKRIRAVKEAAKEEGVGDFVVNARSDAYLMGGKLDDSIRRGKRYLDEGGADTVFIFWPRGEEMKREDLQRVIYELGGKVNVSCRLGESGKEGWLSPGELGRMGAIRVSVGPQVYSAAQEAIKEVAGRVFGV